VSYKRGLAVVFGCVIAALVSFAATYPRFHPGAATAPAASTPAKAGAAGEPSLTVDFPPLNASTSPLSWARLSEAQHTALAPFAGEWDRFSEERKRKWLKIASRYAKMSPEAQKRLQERMTEWVRMTPEQRRVARENYQVSKELPPQARQNAWKAYQALSEEQKERLAATERKRRPTVVSAPPSGKSEIRGINRLLNAREHAAGASAVQPGAVPAAATSQAASALPAAPAMPLPSSSSLPPTPVPVSPSEAPSVFNGS
jgi:hypothetical protein